MQPDREFWNGRRVGVTGGTGFLGWQIVSLLRDLGAEVRVLALEPEWSHPIHRLPALTTIWADVRDAATVRRALEGCSVVFHTAGMVGVWGAAMERMWSVHVEGTANVLASAPRDARIVHTSSLTTIGASRDGDVLTEDAPPRFHKTNLGYVKAKRAAEELALRAARDGRHLTITNPGYLVGPEDYERSIMGRFCVRYWKGRLPMSPPGGLNLIDVRDAAAGHLLAAEHGQPGRRYILGGENHHFPSLLNLLASVAQCLPRALLRVPWLIMACIATLAELRSKFTGKEPYPSLGHARLNRWHWFGDSSRAALELGYTFRPLIASLRDAYAWHQARNPIHPRGLPRWFLRPAA